MAADRSIYARPNDAVTGGSAQAHYEHLWGEGQRRRLITRGVLTVVALGVGIWLFNPIVGVALAVLVAVGDTWYQYRKHASTAAWRAGDDGYAQTSRLLRRWLEWRGYTVLRNRRMPESAGADAERVEHLAIGPAGVFLVASKAWAPELRIGMYGGRLFFGKRPGEKTVTPVGDTARAVAAVLTRERGTDVPVTPVLAVYGGQLPGRAELQAEDVTLLRAQRVPGWIRRYRSESGGYSTEQVTEIARTAARLMRPRPLLPRE